MNSIGASLEIPFALVYGFLLVLARVAGVFSFVPLPGSGASMAAPRIVLSVAVTFSLFRQWPPIGPEDPGIGRLAGWILAEGALGLSIGLVVAFITEAFVFAAQVMGLQAGYAYASTVDPTTQADAGILLVLSQLIAGLLFFAFGLDREILRAFAGNLQAHPPGTWVLTRPMAEQVLRLGSEVFSTGMRVAMPAVGLLILIDVGLSLLGRINAQLQLLTLAFPLKMMVTLVLLAWIAVLFPTVFRGYSSRMLHTATAHMGF
jgi:flagellar biosynthetic protein FliR